MFQATQKLTLCIVIVAAATTGTATSGFAQEAFSSKTIDIGVVVSDIEKSVKFYRDAIGMKESGGFSVPAEFTTKTGLADGHDIEIKIMTLGDGDGATKLKLMQVPKAPGEIAANNFIHTTLGFSYITINVTNTEAAVDRLKKHGVKTLAQTPSALPAPLPTHILLTMVRDPDGNFVELVGPKNAN